MPDHLPEAVTGTDRKAVIGTTHSLGKPISRRDLLKLLIHGLAGIVLGGSVSLINRAREGRGVLRPPGALSEEHFRALCLLCGKCEEICPQRVIQSVTLAENIETAGSPRLSFAENYCNLCMECTKVCPTGALQRIRQSDVLIGIAEVLHERCSAWSGGNCYFCVTRCPFQAIRRDGAGRPYVVAELCTGCGICEQACRLTASMGFTKGVVVVPVG